MSRSHIFLIGGDMAGGTEIEATHAARRAPIQQRSRERLEKILAVAGELIAARVGAQLKMSEVAERAGISIGSLYQYFPDKGAILRTLADRYNLESRRCIEEGLAGVTDLASLEAAYGDLFDQYYAIVLAEPVMRDIWSGMQADRELLALEMAESRVAGGMLAAAMKRVHPQVDAQRIDTVAFLIWRLGEATVRMAIDCDRAEGDALVEAFKRMSLREVLAP
jgi:AcrR family transcriptional regulator